MTDRSEPLPADHDGAAGALPGEDHRKPYEPPRLLKKRSVARATLFTAVGVMMSGLTTMG